MTLLLLLLLLATTTATWSLPDPPEKHEFLVRRMPWSRASVRGARG
jgi:hypothetical protein